MIMVAEKEMCVMKFVDWLDWVGGVEGSLSAMQCASRLHHMQRQIRCEEFLEIPVRI